MTNQCCPEDGTCPQHLQQAQEDMKWSVDAMQMRRQIGGSKFFHLGVIIA